MTRTADPAPVDAIARELGLESLRLAPGSHDSPREGVCVVELASVLGGEDFSDRPDCVCEVIGAFLRAWNDRTGYHERQRLRPYAGRAVGTQRDRDTTRLRRDVCLIWADVELDCGPVRRFVRLLAVRLRIAALIGLRPALHLDEGAGEYAARLVYARYGTEAGFTLLDRLLAIGEGATGDEHRAQAEAARPGASRNGASANGHGPTLDSRNGASRNGSSQNGHGLNGSSRNGSSQNGSSRNGSGRNGDSAGSRATGAPHTARGPGD